MLLKLLLQILLKLIGENEVVYSSWLKGQLQCLDEDICMHNTLPKVAIVVLTAIYFDKKIKKEEASCLFMSTHVCG
ncbi:hypothetical protein IMY05_003G0054900 [Salix suchowensis]|nr:hypothetical protein IMY05_003G0054900 [Salix suchowensis]